MKIISQSPAQTQKIGLKLAKKLRGGEIIGLVGDLGAGKTCWVQGLVRGFKVKKAVKSPSFIILNIYPVAKNKKIQRILHWDLYRLRNYQELETLGFSELLYQPQMISVIEWADKIAKYLPPKTLWIRFKTMGLKQREIVLSKNS